jgi:hypothetical protein
MSLNATIKETPPGMWEVRVGRWLIAIRVRAIHPNLTLASQSAFLANDRRCAARRRAPLCRYLAAFCGKSGHKTRCRCRRAEL